MSLASLSESFEPMQVDAEENDNDDGDMRMVADAMMAGGNVARNAVVNVLDTADDLNFNVENPSIDIETYASSK